ncbi:MAG TPA: hypothetical protein VHY91_06105 [Pirellulales bacterium]|jgi:hypothetical protein|nr:hypothetical protein [Pirellulales bacterium]
MASPQQKFWKLIIDSRLLALEECQQLHAEFRQVSQAPPDDVSALAKWLVGQGVLSRYQARVLLSGKPGPFWIGEYKIVERHDDGQIKGLFEALSRSTGQRVLLFVMPLAAGQDLAKLHALARKVQKAVAATAGQLKETPVFAVQGSLTYAVLSDLTPPPVIEPAPEAPASEPEQPAADWVVEIPVAPSRPRRRRSASTFVGWGVALVMLAAGGAVGWHMYPQWAANGGTDRDKTSTTAANDGASPDESAGSGGEGADGPPTAEDQVAWEVRRPAGAAEPAVEMIADDGQTLWAAPTSGPPLNLGYLPAGPQAILALRPAELVGSVEGAKMLEALGPASGTAAATIQAMTFCQWPELEQLQIGLYPVETGPVQAAFVARLAPGITAETWTERLPNRKPAKHAGKHYIQSGDWAYYLPEAESGRLIVIAPPAEIEKVIDAGGPQWTKEMERLLADTDEQRHFTILGEPLLLLSGAGRTIFVGQLERLAMPLRRFLGARVQAALVSGQVGDELFLELRAYGQADVDPRQLAAHYREELAALPGQFDAYLGTLEPQPYGQAVLQRLPKMLDQLQRFTRSGAEHHQAVLRCYLPAVAGHNLLMGTELALAEVPKSAGKEGKGGGKKSGDVATALAKKVSISFPRDTLEKSLEMLSTEIGVEIVILGSDLQLEGITKNQSFSLDERDQPAVEILTKILKLANSDGKLVYVIKPREAGSEPILFVTTRAAVKKRGETLPPELEKK